MPMLASPGKLDLRTLQSCVQLGYITAVSPSSQRSKVDHYKVVPLGYITAVSPSSQRSKVDHYKVVPPGYITAVSPSSQRSKVDHYLCLFFTNSDLLLT